MGCADLPLAVLPSSGSSTASMVSPMSSISSVCPSDTAWAMMSRYLRAERGGVFWQACALWGAWAAVGDSQSALLPLCVLGPHCALPVLAPTELLEVSGIPSGLLPLVALNLVGDMIAQTLHPSMAGKGGLVQPEPVPTPQPLAHLRWPRRTICRSSPYLFLIHLLPCSWASTSSGHRWVLQRMAAFSVEVRSLGSPWLFQAATSAESVRRLRGSRSGVMGMGTCREGLLGAWLQRCGSPRCFGHGGRNCGMEPVASYRLPIEKRDPVLLQKLSPVLLGEVSDVGHEGRHQQHIPAQRLLLLPELLHGFRPADVFGCQAPDKPVGLEGWWLLWCWCCDPGRGWVGTQPW